MGTSRRDMYKFVWDEGEDPDTEPAQTSPKDLVANILRETELPDLNLDTQSNASRKSNNSRGLNTEQELFSIDDDGDDYDFDETFNISGRVSQKEAKKANRHSEPKASDHSFNKTPSKSSQQRSEKGLTSYGRQDHPAYRDSRPDNKLLSSSSKPYERKSPAKVPPLVSVHHPTLSHLEEGAVTSGYTGYPDNRDNNNEDSGGRKSKAENKSALLEMEFEDDADSGVADTEVHPDTQPIVTLDQGKLAARWRTRRQKINFFVAAGLVVLGVVVLTVVLIVVIKTVR